MDLVRRHLHEGRWITRWMAAALCTVLIAFPVVGSLVHASHLISWDSSADASASVPRVASQSLEIDASGESPDCHCCSAQRLDKLLPPNGAYLLDGHWQGQKCEEISMDVESRIRDLLLPARAPPLS